jgi:gamma-carbonic anhydrase
MKHTYADVSIVPYKGKTPAIAPSAYLAAGVRLSGDIAIEKDASFWFNVAARGDVGYIRVGEGSNVQDNSVLHVTTSNDPTIIGAFVTVGHNAIIHSCTIEDLCIIGMGSIILDNARIPKHSFVAAGSVVPPGKTYPPGHLILGSPAKAVRLLSSSEIEGITKSAQGYMDLAKSYMLSRSP